MKIRWDHPTPLSEEALDFESALKEIRGNDPRPMIVLRDCDLCKGKDDALLSKTLNNEKTLLYTQGFHCLRLDRRVIEKSHPWHALFAAERPPHLFFSTWDGTNVIPLPGTQSQKHLWNVMANVLKTDYKRDAKIAVKNWLRVLDKFDSIESRKAELERQRDEYEAKGKPQRAARAEKDLHKLAKELDKSLAMERKLMDLVLRHAPKAKTLADFDGEAAGEVRAGTGSGLLKRIRQDAKKGEKGDN